MSSVMSGALATRREQSHSGTSTSTQPPGLSTYVDVVAALVPAEVLAINAIVVTLTTKSVPGGGTQPTDPATLRLSFWLLLGLSSLLYLLGRQQSLAQAGRPRGWTPADAIRVVIPAAAFTGWALMSPASAWSAVVPGMSSGTRILIGVVGATAIAAITKVLATHADLKPAPGQVSAAGDDSPGQAGGNGQPRAGQAGTLQPMLAAPMPAPTSLPPAPAPPVVAGEPGPWWVSGQ